MNNAFFTTAISTSILTFSLLFASGQALAATAAGPVIDKAGDLAGGEAQSVVCSGCHGADGNSPVPNFPKLAGLGEKYLTKQLQDIQAGNQQMADLQAGRIEEKDLKSGTRPVAQMAGLLQGKSLQDLKDLAAFYNSKSMQLSGSKPQEVRINAGIKVDGLTLGERLYRSGNLETGVPACTACHSPQGLGNAAAGYPRLSGQYPEYIAAQLRSFRAGERTNGAEAEIMRQAAQYMSDAEIDAVANFLAGLN
jgi:cytochrome c553